MGGNEITDMIRPQWAYSTTDYEEFERFNIGIYFGGPGV
jgi:hypothetical protein